jgi:hypothetical protein
MCEERVVNRSRSRAPISGTLKLVAKTARHVQTFSNMKRRYTGHREARMRVALVRVGTRGDVQPRGTMLPDAVIIPPSIGPGIASCSMPQKMEKSGRGGDGAGYPGAGCVALLEPTTFGRARATRSMVSALKSRARCIVLYVDGQVGA